MWRVQAGQELITRGPYRLVRHPTYTGALITFVASCALLRSWVVATFAAMALTAAFLRRIRCEEALLLSALPGYDAYVALNRKTIAPALAGSAVGLGIARDIIR